MKIVSTFVGGAAAHGAGSDGIFFVVGDQKLAGGAAIIFEADIAMRVLDRSNDSSVGEDAHVRQSVATWAACRFFGRIELLT